MEIDIDDVIWKDDIVTVAPVIENGDFFDVGPHIRRNTLKHARQRGHRVIGDDQDADALAAALGQFRVFVQESSQCRQGVER